MQVQTETLISASGGVTDAGLKPINQDCIGSKVPRPDSSVCAKGALFCIADGISSSTVSQIASDLAVSSFIEQYYFTPDSWEAKEAASQALALCNADLFSKNQNSSYKYDLDKGYVCTFSALLIADYQAHIFHIGDSQVCRIRDGRLAVLTEEHRRYENQEKSYLQKALGIKRKLEADTISVDIQAKDVFILTTDGIYEYVDHQSIVKILQDESDIQKACETINTLALKNGSGDNLSIQAVRIASKLNKIKDEAQLSNKAKKWATNTTLRVGQNFDGYTIERILYQSNRSYIYLATEIDTGAVLKIKVPSIDKYDDPVYMRGFALEEWICRRIKSPYVISAPYSSRARTHHYIVQEYIEGQTLDQWLLDNKNPPLEKVREIIEQIGSGLNAMHRSGTLHQDIRPENIIINQNNTIKIIDLAGARVIGLTDTLPEYTLQAQGSLLYAAPEYFLGELGSEQSDLFSLAVLSYYLLSGHYPYGNKVPRCDTRASQRKLKYVSVMHESKKIPHWFDLTLRQALHINPIKRTESISEFLHDLRHPNPSFLNRAKAPLLERYPNRFWQVTSFILLATNIILLLVLKKIIFF